MQEDLLKDLHNYLVLQKDKVAINLLEQIDQKLGILQVEVIEDVKKKFCMLIDKVHECYSIKAVGGRQTPIVNTMQALRDAACKFKSMPHCLPPDEWILYVEIIESTKEKIAFDILGVDIRKLRGKE